MVGFFGGEARISLPQMVSGSRQIKGIYVGSIEQLKQLLQLVAAKKVSGNIWISANTFS